MKVCNQLHASATFPRGGGEIPRNQLDRMQKLCQNCGEELKILTTIVMMNSISWDITPCSPLKVSRRVGGK
jgi:hypothetical protein